MVESEEKRFLVWKKLREEIDATIAKSLGKSISHHITRVTGGFLPKEYVAFVDGTEQAYSSEQENALAKAQYYRETGARLY